MAREAKAKQQATPTDDTLHPLTVALMALGYGSYMQGLNAIVAGELPAERIKNRWYVRQSIIEAILAGR